MQIRTIRATYGRKFNLGNYQSASIEISAWAEIEEAEDPATAAAELRRFCRRQVREEFNTLPKPEQR